MNGEDTERELHPSEIEKHLAEARKFDAEAAQATAEIGRIDLEKIKISQETAYTKALARGQDALAEQVEIVTRKERQAEQDELSRDRYHHTYSLTSGIDGDTVSKAINHLAHWKRSEPPSEIEFIINSPGGSLVAGMTLFDYILQMRKEGWKFTTIAYGYAASMGGILLQAGDWRVMGAEAYILIHEVSSISLGKVSEMEDEMIFLKMIQKRIINLFVSRSEGKISEATFKRNWTRKDWWLDSAEALRKGIVDEIA